jgi:hypothetical protein
MTVVQQLFDLLGVDVEIDRNSQTVASVDASLVDNRLLVQTQRAVKAARDTLRVQESERLNLELTVGTSQDKGKQLESKLYGGTVRIPRELEDMQLELSLLREQQKQQEESLLLALEVSEETEQALGDLESNLQEMQTSWQEEHERLLEERAQLQENLDMLGEKRQQLSSLVNPQHLKIYDSLRFTRQGQAVSRVERGICQGCRISLPTRVVQQARSSLNPVQCPSCSRILYVS